MKKVSLALTALCASLLSTNVVMANNSRLAIFFTKYCLAPAGLYVGYHAANCKNDISNWWRSSIVKKHHENMKCLIKKNTHKALDIVKKGTEKAKQVKEDL